MSKVILIDIAKCSGCYNCQLACKDEHCENDWTPYAAPQPLTGHFWCKVTEHVQGTIPKVKIHYIPKMCAHCTDAKCAAACPVGAIYRRDDDGLILIDPSKCVGCKSCMAACPHGVIYFNDKLGISQKCTGCAHLLDNGAKQPRCVEVCPTDAMVYAERDELDLEGATPLDETGRLYYKNIPGEFIGGTVYDPVEKEVVIGGECILTGEGTTYTVKTNSYGDFWFKNLPKDGNYTLEIKAEGFKTSRFDNLSTSASVNLGDIPLEKE
jgi:Fe-S-cluster-containing dehydrogenase component